MTQGRSLHQRLVLANLKTQALMEEARLDQERLRVRERQQAAIAELGQRALGGLDLQTLMDETVELLASTLDVENADVLELLPNGDVLLLRAGVGWKDGLVGRATVSAGQDTQAGHSLLTRRPVIVEDLREEERFHGPSLLVEHGIISGISVVIEGHERPFGVVGVHTTRKRRFAIDDVHFVQAVVNVLASAIERSRVEDELRSSGDQLRTILEGIADGITVQDRSGKLIFANDAAARTLGYATAEQLLQTPIAELLSKFEMRDERDFPVSPSLLPGRRALEGEAAPEITIRFRNIATGEERWSVVKARAILDEHGKPEMAINIFRDITDKKRTEETQRFLADATGVLASSLNYETTLSRVAALAVPRVADWCAVHLVGDNGAPKALAVTHVDPAKVEIAREYNLRFPPRADDTIGIANVMRTGQPEIYPEVSEELLVSASRGEEHLKAIREIGMKSVMILPMVARGRTLGAITFVSAESGRRFGSEDLAIAQHLARRSALAVDNARLFREAQDAIKVRNELFSSVSHDLKNPLTGMKGMAQLLERQVARLNIPGKNRILEGLASIDSTATRMTSQIDELLDLASLQMGQSPELKRRPTDLVSLVRGIASEQQRTTERHRIEVRAEGPEIIGNWDALRIARVVTNLVANAVKYSPRGGEVLVTVGQEERGGRPRAVLTVQDHGMGIPAPDLDKVFESFQRGGNVEGSISGTGLGLTSAQQIIQLHGGTIEVASQMDAGSTFTVRLPLEADAERQSAA